MNNYAAEYARRQKILDKITNDKEAAIVAANHYRNDPVSFINDFAVTHDPRVTPALMPFNPWPKQVEFLEWLHDKWKTRTDGLVEKTRDCGVSWLCCAFAWWLWIWHEGRDIGFGSRKMELVDKRGDPKCIFEKIRTLLEYTPQCFMPEGFNWKTDSVEARLLNRAKRSTITGEGGDEIGRGGRTSIYFKDESAYYQRPEKIEAALSQNSDVKIDISTPNGIGNPFYRKRWGGEIDVFTFLWKDDPRKDQAWYEKQKKLLDPVILAQEVDISYDASVDNSFIEPEFVRAAMERSPSEFDLTTAPLTLGIDPARFGQDKTAFCLRQGRVIHWVKTYEKISTMEVVGKAVFLIENSLTPLNVFIDTIGIGAGVFDRLQELFPDNVWSVSASMKSGNDICSNKRSELWHTMREWLYQNCSIPNEDRILTDLCSLQYSFNSDGQYVLEGKREAKARGIKSPDIADAIALTFFLPAAMLLRRNDEFMERERKKYGIGSDLGRNETTGY